jgi:hypothetical protein
LFVAGVSDPDYSYDGRQTATVWDVRRITRLVLSAFQFPQDELLEKTVEVNLEQTQEP